MIADPDCICSIAACAMWTPQTEGMLDEAAFAAAKQGAYFINIARDGMHTAPCIEPMQYARVNVVPPRTKRSRFGVRMCRLPSAAMVSAR